MSKKHKLLCNLSINFAVWVCRHLGCCQPALACTEVSHTAHCRSSGCCQRAGSCYHCTHRPWLFPQTAPPTGRGIGRGLWGRYELTGHQLDQLDRRWRWMLFVTYHCSDSTTTYGCPSLLSGALRHWKSLRQHRLPAGALAEALGGGKNPMLMETEGIAK